MSVTYNRYLQVDELLELQKPLSDGPEHDEMLFIVIHQVYELWFKQVLHEMNGLQEKIDADDVYGSLHSLKRILTIFKTLVGQVDILETMTPLSFLSFRARLDKASGFQSAQFRELEFLLGHRDSSKLKNYEEGSAWRERLEAGLRNPSIYDSFISYLGRLGYTIPDEVLDRDKSQVAVPSKGLQKILIDVYKNRPGVAQICERMVDLDEGLQEWRYRHVKMVERTIGTKIGTGGSDGAEYLRRTLFRSVFPDLWAIRAAL
ncbi:MAG: tryptophan 2,3-dioxygenase [Myxococcales bacterium]|nr:tryptophan 2,3-dioxygenase [Myxococcales bacterium]